MTQEVLKGMSDSKKYKIGYVPGVYDMFHRGHLNLINKCREQSDYLIVGVLSDELVIHFKKRPPIIPYEDRAAIVSALRAVDEVVKVDFSNTVKMDAWELYHYDAYFSGSDHEHDWDDERRALQAVGSDIVFFPYTAGVSSTILRQETNAPVYIFGAGIRGKRLASQAGFKVAGFLDNDDEKHLTRVDGIVVYKPEDLLRLEKEEDRKVIISMKNAGPAILQLQELGIKNYEVWQG